MGEISASVQHACLTHYLGREHFDAFACTKDGEHFPRFIASKLFNELVDSDFYGYDNSRRTRSGDRYPRRLVFDLRPSHIQDILITAKRTQAGIGPYPDEYPILSNITGSRAARNALETAIEVGSLISLVEIGIQNKLHTSSKKGTIATERLAKDLILHLQ